MILFKYKFVQKSHIVDGRPLYPDGMIFWWAEWDGQHDDQWYADEVNLIDSSIRNHPFYKTADFTSGAFDPDSMKGMSDCCVKSPVTMALCEALAHPDQGCKYRGVGSKYSHWTTLLGCLSQLWD